MWLAVFMCVYMCVCLVAFVVDVVVVFGYDGPRNLGRVKQAHDISYFASIY